MSQESRVHEREYAVAYLLKFNSRACCCKWTSFNDRFSCVDAHVFCASASPRRKGFRADGTAYGGLQLFLSPSTRLCVVIFQPPEHLSLGAPVSWLSVSPGYRKPISFISSLTPFLLDASSHDFLVNTGTLPRTTASLTFRVMLVVPCGFVRSILVQIETELRFVLPPLACHVDSLG